MNILLCERNVEGHRKNYMKWLLNIKDVNFFYYSPESLTNKNKNYFFYKKNYNNRSFVGYFLWIKEIRKIVRKEHIDIVHILDGDSIMRFCGIGLHSFGCKHVVITYHHFFCGWIRKIVYFLMNYGKDHSCVVHTKSVLSQIRACHIKHVDLCDYPSFGFFNFLKLNKDKCKDRFNLVKSVPTIGIIGGLTDYKNILPFLYILRKCNKEFQLLICGEPIDLTNDDIDKAVAPYRNKVKKVIKVLTEDEYQESIMASDIIYSLYGLNFDGASGPLLDGVCSRKFIFASSHGSLGNIVSSNNLGITSDVSNENMILTNVELALSCCNSFYYNREAELYRKNISPYSFQNTYKLIYNKYVS